MYAIPAEVLEAMGWSVPEPPPPDPNKPVEQYCHECLVAETAPPGSVCWFDPRHGEMCTERPPYWPSRQCAQTNNQSTQQGG